MFLVPLTKKFHFLSLVECLIKEAEFLQKKCAKRVMMYTIEIPSNDLIPTFFLLNNRKSPNKKNVMIGKMILSEALKLKTN